MKKILTTLLAVLLLFTVAGCATEKDAFDLYQSIAEAQAKLTSMEATTDITAKVEMEGMALDMTMSGTIRQVMRSETDIDLEMQMQMSMMGMDMDMATYYKDGYMYQEVMGQKGKTKADITEVVAQANAAGALEITRDAILNGEVVKEGDNTRLKFELNPTFMEDALSAITASMMDSLMGADMTVDIRYITYEVLVDKSYIPQTTYMEFGMDMTVEGQAVAVDYVVNTETVSVNSIDAISFPADLDTYPEAEV